MDEIAELVGVQPKIKRMLFTDPKLALKLVFGPCTPYQFRLRGPGKWAKARQAILTQWERMAQPMQTRPCDEPPCHSWLTWPVVLASVTAGVAAYMYRNSLCTVLQDPMAWLDWMKSFLPAENN